MSDAKLVNIARLMTTYNFEIEQLPDNLKCAQCKSVLKDACQLSCCCRYCRVCIVDMIERGGEFCPGDTEDCEESLLSLFSTDHVANKKVWRVAVKCPHDGCVYTCQLANIEEHLRECPRKSEECPFRELGCTQDILAADEMGGHLQHDNRRHSKILIAMMANINREIESLKQKDEASSREIETLKGRHEASRIEIETMKQKDEASSRDIETLRGRHEASRIEIETLKGRHEASRIEIETLKQKDEASSREIETLRGRDKASRIEVETLKGRHEASSREIETLEHELVQKDGQIRSIMDQMIHVQNDIKLIQEEKEDLAGRVTMLTEKIDREIAERRENDEVYLDRVIEHVGKEIAAVTRLIGSNKDESAIDMQSVRCDIGSINQSVQSIKDDICFVNSQVQSVQALVGLGQVDASFVWLIDIDIDKTGWWWGDRLSEYFTGAVHLYKYRLASANYDIGTADAALLIGLLIFAGPNNGQLAWPFEARVVITVTDRDRREACRSISLQCRIERPPDNQYRWSDPFEFLHSELREAGLNLSRGVRVSCVIVPGAS